MGFPGEKLELPLMNAGGTCKYAEEVERFARSVLPIVMVNILVEERPGNSGDTYWSNGIYSLNSKGLPSPGKQYYQKHLPAMVRTVHAAGKLIGVNISGFTPHEYADLYQLALEAGVDFVELNFGCPNLWEGSVQKFIMSFDIGGMMLTLRLIGELGGYVPTSIKLSPYSDPAMIQVVCQLLTQLAESDLYLPVEWLTLCNTFPNGFMLDPKTSKPVISGTGLAGIGGKAMMPIALGQIKQFRMKQEEGSLPENVKFIGVGGITTQQDIDIYLAAGATLVQAATAFFDGGESPAAYGDILLR